MRRARVVTSLAILALTGCGDAPSREEFVARADEVCARHNARLTNIAREGTSRAPLSADDRGEWTRHFFDAYADMVDELAELERPEGDALVERYIDKLERNARGYRAGEPFANGSRDLAKELGLRECSSFVN